MLKKYLNKAEIDEIIGIIKVPEGFLPMSQDSYNEKMIAQSITRENGQEDLLACAINMSLVGYGNKKYGQFRLKDQIVDISTIFRKYNVKVNTKLNDTLLESDLTPNRLCRFFRHHIREYIIQNKLTSYLWRKYSDRDERFAHICFRGAEYLDDLTQEEMDYLIEATGNLDFKLGTTIKEKVIRVLEAKQGKLIK
jgi:hypothetical protein